jgi:membrane-associated PAP2 superfamily phosphatase
MPRSWVIVPAAMAVVLWLVGDLTDLDRVVSHLAFDAQTRGFPLRTDFWLDVVLHHWAKYAVITISAIIVAGLLLSFVLPAVRGQRRLLTFISLALILAPLSVTLAKASSARHCPWDISEFGGTVPYERLFEANAAGVAPGHCFPAGHASTGFALMAFYFAAYSQGARRLARKWLAAGIVAGLGLGFARILQGAHFLTHVLWSGLLCWTVMVLVYRVCLQETGWRRKIRRGNS